MDYTDKVNGVAIEGNNGAGLFFETGDVSYKEEKFEKKESTIVGRQGKALLNTFTKYFIWKFFLLDTVSIDGDEDDEIDGKKDTLSVIGQFQTI